MELPAEFFQSGNCLRAAMSFLKRFKPAEDFFIIVTDGKIHGHLLLQESMQMLRAKYLTARSLSK